MGPNTHRRAHTHVAVPSGPPAGSLRWQVHRAHQRITGWSQTIPGRQFSPGRSGSCHLSLLLGPQVSQGRSLRIPAENCPAAPQRPRSVSLPCCSPRVRNSGGAAARRNDETNRLKLGQSWLPARR